jgi:anti-sigma factor (TIGR02949 family)
MTIGHGPIHPDRMTCEEVVRRLDDYLDRELTSAEMRRVSEHLETCATCASEFAFETSVVSEIRSKLRRIAAPQELIRKVGTLLATEREKIAGEG